MPVTTERPGPYAPPSAILEIINRRRDRGLTAPINADVLTRASIPQSLIPRTLQSLQALDLINEAGEPTPTFEALRVAPSAEFQTRLQEWLKSAYADVFAFVDPTQDDEVKITDAFRAYNPAGQRPRMVSLFRELCSAAGLSAKSSDGPKPVSPPKPRIASAVSRPSAISRAVGRASITKPASSLPPALGGLMESLPAPETGWTSDERGKFLKTFETVLDFCIPVVKKTAAKVDEEAA